MRLGTFLAISAVVALVYGLGFVFLPGFLLGVYGVAAVPASILGFRFFGTALIAIGLTTWVLRDNADWQAIRALLLGVVIGNVIGFLVALFATFNGTMGPMGWSAVLIYLLLGGGEAYFLSRGPSVALERGRY